MVQGQVKVKEQVSVAGSSQEPYPVEIAQLLDGQLCIKASGKRCVPKLVEQ